ncbi:MAG: phosphoribosylaminoimidazolesuccinocarboxamide synthase [Synechococcus sp.]|nr:phosphoribosylaminoimidazolesuccinocarboxamide synthase [Synechococcus sp.]
MTPLQPADLLHEGKAKKVFRTDRPGVVAVQYKDDATAFNALKKAQLAGKGLLNWEISARLFEALEADGIPSHYLGCLEPGWMVVQEVEIVPVEVVLRNRAAGSLCRQLPIEVGTPLQPALLDLYYKDDALGDPLLTEARLELLGLLTPVERAELERLARAVNTALQRLFGSLAIELVDFKLEFGRDAAGRLLLADEISPDTCRLWDTSAAQSDVQGRILDKDRFRQDLGGVVEAYGEVLKRVQGLGSAPRLYR